MTRTSTRRDATRLRLYEAAVALIGEQGFAATTVEQIAERAGVAKGTVYYNFAGKTELFEELLRHGVGPLTAALRDAAGACRARGGGAGAALDAMARAGLAFVASRADFARLLVAEQWRANRPWSATLRAARADVVAAVADVLQEGVKDGELDEALDVELTAGALLGTVMVGALDWRTFHPGRTLDEVHAALSPVLLARLGEAGGRGHAGGR
ncbi:TetR/AcrR family transcriptional regulator [Streptomyces sp. RFCAC02]|uniref:TetR/AcrR family transcriptional regulator n=1 Tax=Streptomyces sp. RFCAC02 TaxID=2499143 RepID=UPI00101EED29|nr:TetR/AcrR family transcriptional regulator [Streptomyces sp. RFCAC02]